MSPRAARARGARAVHDAGLSRDTTPRIAKKAGVAEGTIYRHFTSKQHCFNELYRTAARWAGQLVKDADALKVDRARSSPSSPAGS